MRKILLLVSFILFCAVTATAQKNIEAPKPTALVVDSKGELTDLEPGDDYSGEAPVTVRFYANAPEEEGYSLTCVWQFFKEGEEEPYLVRHDADVEIELRESGSITVMPNITYTSIEDSGIFWPFDGAVDLSTPLRSLEMTKKTIKIPSEFSLTGFCY